MAHLHPDRRLRGLRTALVAAGALLCLLPAHAANDRQEAIAWKGINTSANFNTGALSTENLELLQGSTLLKASKAEATGLVDGSYENSTWKLTGDVHLKFDGAVLDAQAATVIFAGGRMKTVQIQPAPAPAPRQPQGPVHMEFNGAVLDAQTAEVTFADGRMQTVQAQGAQGAPAQFSHQLRNSPRRVHGRAGEIDYDAGKNLMRVSGNVWFSHGSNEFETQELTYNLDDGSFRADAASRGTIRPDERVPAPRTPDRASAR